MGKRKAAANYLDLVPRRQVAGWHAGEDGLVTLEVEHRGVVHTLAQKLLHKPRISYIHLDEMGSFVWPLIDGARTVGDLAGPVKERFGEAAEPLYPRLVRYFQVLESYGFVTLGREK